MVDIGGKNPMIRTARAEGRIILRDETVALIRENLMKKGDVLAIAEIAGIQSAKLTHHLVPLCHPLLLNHISVVCRPGDKHVYVESEVSCNGKTGVEMEALTAVSTALLTVYDMCKAVDKEMKIEGIRLVSKTKTSPETSPGTEKVIRHKNKKS